MAKPTKEDKIGRKAKKTQRKSHKEPAGDVRRDRDGIGKLIDSTGIRNPNEDFGKSAARIETEATEGWKPQKVCGCGGMLQCDHDRDRLGRLQSQTEGQRLECLQV